MGGRQSKQGEKMMGAERVCQKGKPGEENKSERLEDRESAKAVSIIRSNTLSAIVFFLDWRVLLSLGVKEVGVRHCQVGIKSNNN